MSPTSKALTLVAISAPLLAAVLIGCIVLLPTSTLARSAGGEAPECYHKRQPGTCYPSVEQCQSCCVGEADCGSPTGGQKKVIPNVPRTKIQPKIQPGGVERY
jgi:hypothetical protein